MSSARAAVPVLVPEWPAHPRVRAAMTTRQGGVSAPPFNTLNLGTHVVDLPANVAENRRRVRESLSLPSEPAWLEQVHSTTVYDLDSADLAAGSAAAAPDLAVPRSASVRADAAVTRQPDRVCVIQVADCMPVLLAARDGSVIGAAHAGWRGLAGGVLEATLRAMRAGPVGVLAWLGPAIGPAHFEVGDEVRAAFMAHDPSAVIAFTRNAKDKWLCDLYALARQRLNTLGVTHISGGGHCTYSDSTRFFSYRRDGRCGRMGAFIWLES